MDWTYEFEHMGILSGAGAIPEPGTWAMMLAGFGLVGGAVRRRRALPSPG